jgi:signal transduction histidine kinase
VLGALNFGAELLQDDNLARDEARRKHIVASVRRNSQRAIKIIRSFERLPRSRIMSDSPIEQVVDVGESIQEALRQLQDMAQARAVELGTIGSFPSLYLDAGALELTLINLVSNAIKYSDSEKPRKFVEVSGHLHDDAFELRVSDNGIGIPAAAHDKVFERFTRAHAELDDVLGVDGTGLGLSIVEECVRALSGQIAFESQEGAGTTFTVMIPKRLPPLAPS